MESITLHAVEIYVHYYTIYTLVWCNIHCSVLWSIDHIPHNPVFGDYWPEQAEVHSVCDNMPQGKSGEGKSGCHALYNIIRQSVRLGNQDQSESASGA